MSDATTPTSTTFGSRIERLYDAAQITKCTNLLHIPLLAVGLGLAWLFRAIHG